MLAIARNGWREVAGNNLGEGNRRAGNWKCRRVEKLDAERGKISDVGNVNRRFWKITKEGRRLESLRMGS